MHAETEIKNHDTYKLAPIFPQIHMYTGAEIKQIE